MTGKPVLNLTIQACMQLLMKESIPLTAFLIYIYIYRIKNNNKTNYSPVTFQTTRKDRFACLLSDQMSEPGAKEQQSTGDCGL